MAENNTPHSGFSKKRLIYIISIVIGFVICYLVVGYLFVNKSISDNVLSAKSIAVLPFKDFSPDDNQWFSDGVSDNILHSLAQMNELRVISFTSSSTYRDTEKQIPQIAKELKVSYILEGSVTLYKGKIKIIAQLIDSNDQHIWSKEYDENFDDVISIQNNVAQEIMKQLEITLSPQEEKTLKKYPTENMEAYNLHLEGRRINQSIKLKDLQKNIENNKKAIALDSSFVDAYVELAATKLVVAIEGYTYAFSAKEAMNYVDKALAIDPDHARANAVKARLLLGDDRGDSEPYFKKALALNPNDAETRHWYAKYLLTAEKPALKEALKQATIANKLSPFSTAIATRYAWLLILNEKYEEAEAYITNYDFLLTADNKHIFTVTISVRKNKDFRPIFDWHANKLKEEPENAAFHYFWLSVGYDQIYIDKRKAVDFAKKTYDLDPSQLSFYFQRIVANGFFEEAELVMQTDDFKGRSEGFKSRKLWEYYYYKKDYGKANDLIKKNPEQYIFSFWHISRTYAQLGDRKKLDSINKLYFVQGEQKHWSKALVHSILKERDSMYYYLHKLKYTYNFGLPLANGSPEFDPYRNEERYKALLREQYIPAEGEQYIPPGAEKFIPIKRD